MAREFRIRTCLECANYVHRHTEVVGHKPDPECSCILIPDVVEHDHTCKLHPDVMKDWWEKHAHKTRKEMTPDIQLDCYELPEQLRLLDDCINKADEILEYLNKKEKDESK